MRIVTIDYEAVRRDCEPGPATRFNTSFCKLETLPRFVDKPSEAPYSFSRWLPLITRSRGLGEDDVQTVILTPQQARLLVDASTASIITRVVSRVHREDLEEMVYPAFSTLTYPPDGRGLFMRLSGCSAKDATCRLHEGRKPQALMLSTENIVLCLATSQRATNDLQRSLDEGLLKIPVFFLPFDARMGSDREYRVFCAPGSGRMTAISQYQWHKPWRLKETGSDPDRMKAVVDRISRGAQELQQEIMAVLYPGRCGEDSVLLEQGFSFDAFYDEDADDVQLVELNVFGARSGLGACLFNWSHDFDLLYGEAGTEGEFRVTF
ncbi:hypothetical protein NLU13_3819 [Sarocladium strictum]|uniref:Cell division cycle protein 123 n=1 Tax=Sarocladium strictum TaxID=5046 RepID=A0AA39L830_SARSR|nr:hypothetical protein NLU13_3819 [Sarocladium strictum]